ncbi:MULTISPECIES: mycofactocin-coupled SDR family oxidoreductase [unclassified Pseudonocardia]|uniref:mycofactocin-coupled SDR family oxidoreductase n=1 Tax=unclassified Pseudonocardia TaxID=2619320 RepID=UPI0001FFE7AC|nr:mycofactocin-coupled SDR family oxidoreductase [Pseudonocardia sp. Ae707_Ps1]OLM09248.1 Short-chain dehydrogenase/reductase SDR [Pseudonocardia sp. Ae707_Ps1]
MSGRLAGKVAFVTGAARGQGRSHAVELAREGADVVAVDICTDQVTPAYAMGTADELAQTAHEVESLGRQVFTAAADVRDPARLSEVLTAAVRELGGLDVVVANAGICTLQPWNEVTPEIWRETLDTNLVGVWNTLAAATPHLISRGGGSMIATSSTAGIKGLPFLGPYTASKHGVVGIARSLANELAKHRIRVNTVHPTGVDTAMLQGMGGLEGLLGQDSDLAPLFVNTLPVETVEPLDISNAVIYLASDEARYVTGTELTVDAGLVIR